MRRSHRWVAFVAGLACCSALAAAATAAADPLLLGIGVSMHDPLGDYDALDWLGLDSVRLDAPWKAIETAPGHYTIPVWLENAVSAARARGVEPQLILAYGHPLHGEDKPRTPAAIAAYTSYCAFVVAHFKGRVRYFDLWNEWDAHTGHTTEGSADDYVALARAAYPAIKSANPDAIVLSGGISSLGLSQGWPARFVELGGLAYVDALSLHPYNFQARIPGTPEGAIAQLDQVHDIAQKSSAHPVRLYVTEMGYPNFEGRGGVSERTSALYLARFLLLASTRDYLGGVWWYCLRDQGADPRNKEHRFGVLNNDLEPKASAQALRTLASILKEVHRFRETGIGSRHRLAAQRADGSTLVLTWTEDADDDSLLNQLTALDKRPKAPVILRSSHR